LWKSRICRIGVGCL